MDTLHLILTIFIVVIESDLLPYAYFLLSCLTIRRLQEIYIM
jgi:hypothetical protein